MSNYVDPYALPRVAEAVICLVSGIATHENMTLESTASVSLPVTEIVSSE